MAKITINGISIDPESDVQEMSLAGLDGPDVSQSEYILVQSPQPLTRDQRRQLEEAGAQILSREQTDPPEAGATYLCAYAPADLSQVRALPFVAAALAYPKQVKVAPELLTAAGDLRAVAFAADLAPATTMAQEPRDVSVVLHPGEYNGEVVSQIAQAARLDPSGLTLEANHVRLRVAPQYLDDLARVDAVHHIEEFVAPKLLNHVALKIMKAEPLHATALDGTGEIVAVCDTGFDTGSTTDTHPAFTGRVRKLYALARPTADDPHGHGTHVAGSVLGDGNSVPMGQPTRGAAPGAHLVLQSVRDAHGKLVLPNDLRDLFRVPYQNDGARIHSNSWGSAVAGRYTPDSRAVDSFIWDNRDCLICFAAGNEGTDLNSDGVIDAGSIGAPATAKNCLSVGASESLRPDISKPWGDPWPLDFPVAPIASDRWADNADGMAAFSSRGPTRDGRIKPDVVAPGTAILSACSRNAVVGSFWGTSSDPLYCFMGGTSMSTPLVAGAAAVLRQSLSSKGTPNPSAALMKALLINGAEDMTGQYVPSEAAGIPNLAEGFGRVNLLRAVAADDRERVTFRDESEALDTGAEHRQIVEAPAHASILKVTLVWTDPPGESLQNDLDLIVRDATGTERHGNMPPGSSGFDRKNNVEQVEWHGIIPGVFEIIVRAHDTPRHPQNFALVIRTS